MFCYIIITDTYRKMGKGYSRESKSDIVEQNRRLTDVEDDIGNLIPSKYIYSWYLLIKINMLKWMLSIIW